MIEQAGCVPFRATEDGYEILLVTTRKGKWIIPKGIVDPGHTPPETAAKEAYEEAGVRGTIAADPIGSFDYRKWGDELHVIVYLLEVTRISDDFEDSDFRRRRWFAPRVARERVREHMRGVLDAAIEILDRRFGGTPPAAG